MKYRNIPANNISIKELPKEERPREKMETLGASFLSDYELLCGLLGRGTKAFPIHHVALDLLAYLSSKDPYEICVKDLIKINGLGTAKAVLVCSSLEFGRRFSGLKKKVINNTEDAFNSIRHYGDRVQEHFLVLILNGALELLKVEVVSVGLVNKTLVHPREVFSTAISIRATSVIIAHNHPSGNLKPSKDDFETTKKISDAGKILGINVLDHIIFSSESYYSIKESDELFLF